MPQQIVLDSMPCPLIAGLFLTPEYIPGLGIAVNLNLEFIMGKRIQLLDTYDCDILDFVLRGDTPADRNIPCRSRRSRAVPFLGSSFSIFRNHVLETAIGEIFEA